MSLTNQSREACVAALISASNDASAAASSMFARREEIASERMSSLMSEGASSDDVQNLLKEEDIDRELGEELVRGEAEGEARNEAPDDGRTNFAAKLDPSAILGGEEEEAPPAGGDYVVDNNAEDENENGQSSTLSAGVASGSSMVLDLLNGRADGRDDEGNASDVVGSDAVVQVEVTELKNNKKPPHGLENILLDSTSFHPSPPNTKTSAGSADEPPDGMLLENILGGAASEDEEEEEEEDPIDKLENLVRGRAKTIQNVKADDLRVPDLALFDFNPNEQQQHQATSEARKNEAQRVKAGIEIALRSELVDINDITSKSRLYTTHVRVMYHRNQPVALRTVRCFHDVLENPGKLSAALQEVECAGSAHDQRRSIAVTPKSTRSRAATPKKGHAQSATPSSGKNFATPKGEKKFYRQGTQAAFFDASQGVLSQNKYLPSESNFCLPMVGYSATFDPFSRSDGGAAGGGNGPHLAIIYEYCDSNNLQEQMSLPVRLKEYDVLRWAKQACMAVKHLHKRGIMLGHLRCRSVSLSSSVMDEREGRMPMDASICDLRGAAKVPSLSESASEDGPCDLRIEHIVKDNYTAPELNAMLSRSSEVDQPELIPQKLDVWAIGCFVFELVTKKILENEELPLHEMENTALSKVPSRFGDIVKHILRRCLKPEPRKR